MSASDIRDQRFNQIALSAYPIPHIASLMRATLAERMRHDLAHEAWQRFAAKL